MVCLTEETSCHSTHLTINVHRELPVVKLSCVEASHTITIFQSNTACQYVCFILSDDDETFVT